MEESAKQILIDMGIWSMGIALVGSESELIRLFIEDFGTLMELCQE